MFPVRQMWLLAPVLPTLIACGLISSVLDTPAPDTRSTAIANAVAAAENVAGEPLDGFCETTGGLMYYEYDVTGTSWSAVTLDPDEVIWTVTCSVNVVGITRAGQTETSDEVLVFLLDYDKWEFTAEDPQVGWNLESIGWDMPYPLDPGLKPD